MAVSSFQFRMLGLCAALAGGTCAWGAEEPKGHAVTPAVPAVGEMEPAKTVEEIEARYTAILLAMKRPPATGVLVAEIGPASAGGRAGLRAGDILVQYHLTRLDDREDKSRTAALRTAVSRAIDDAKRRGVNSTVTMVVKRGEKVLELEADRQPLGIRAITCELGVPLPLNPPASELGSFTLEWKAEAGWYRAGTGRTFDGIEQHAMTLREKQAELLFVAKATDDPAKRPAEVQRATIQLRVSDRSAGPGVTLESLTYRDETVNISANLKAAVIDATIERRLAGAVRTIKYPTLTEAVPSLALPSLAAALPQKEGVVMSVAVISELDLQTRPGYALQTIGAAKFKSGGEEKEGFAVRLWHFGQVEATYFFLPDRTLVATEVSDGAAGVTLQRAADEFDATRGLLLIKAPPGDLGDIGKPGGK